MPIPDILGILGIVALLAVLARSSGAVTDGGALAGIAAGVATWIGLGREAFALLGLFAVLGAASAWVSLAAARRGREDGLGSAARGAHQVLAKLAVPALLALAAASFPEVAAWPLAFSGSIGAAAFDTWASDIGPLGRTTTFAAATLRPVPPGTAGGVSALGTLAGLIGAGAVAAAAQGLGLIRGGEMPIVIGASLLASSAESLAGTLALRWGLGPGAFARNILLTSGGALVAAVLGC